MKTETYVGTLPASARRMKLGWQLRSKRSGVRLPS